VQEAGAVQRVPGMKPAGARRVPTRPLLDARLMWMQELGRVILWVPMRIPVDARRMQLQGIETRILWVQVRALVGAPQM
jgi:hypothetical protein